MYIPSSIMKFKAGLGISMLLILGLQSSTAQAQQFCSKELCISATIFSKDNKTIEFSLTAQIDSVGWVGMGLGGVSGGMAGNDLALCWPDPSGSGALISQRSAIMNGPPTALPTSAFKVQQAKSGVTSNRFMCTFYRPLLLSTSTITSDLKTIGIVFAVGMKPPIPGANGDPQKASFQEHTFTGSGALVIARKEGSSTDYMPTPSATPTPKPTRTPGAGTGNSPSPDAAEVVRTQEQIDALILSHASMMAIAFLIILPLGAMLVRFFSHLHNVFVWHRPIQATGVLLVLAALGCILAALAKKSALNDTPMVFSTHAIIGFFLSGAILVQVCVGLFIFAKYDPSKARQSMVVRIPTWVHRLWGYSVLILGLVQVCLGMKKYGRWPTGKEYIWYIYYTWVGILVIGIFGLGSVLKCVGSRKSHAVDGERSLKSNGVNDRRYNNSNDQGPYELRSFGIHGVDDSDYKRH